MKRFSLWCDFIENGFLDGEFLTLLNSKIKGATSNPSIFRNAILNSASYKDKIARLRGRKAKEIYEELAVLDVQKAADKLALHFLNNDDGFISIEIDPRLYDNTALSLGEAKRLYTAISRENVMIKIPATEASYEVMYELMKNGISVNATLVFSLKQSQKCFEALSEGLKNFRKNNASVKSPQGVISIFVSRFDRLLNNQALEKNRIGVLNANLLYNNIIRNNEPHIRALFASTGVRGDDLAKDYYIKELLFENSINTAPLDAIKAFNADFSFKKALMNFEVYTELNKIISQNERERACEFLLDDGLKQFCTAFEEILSTLSA